MKKILLVALAAATMVGCAQNEEIENAATSKEMKFGTAVMKTTRAGVITNTGFKNFNLYAVNGTEVIIDDKGFTKTDQTWEADGGLKFYWPNDENVSFYGYSAETIGNVTFAKATPSLTYTVNTVLADQEDLLVASLTTKQSANAGGKIDIPFTHALSKMSIKIKGNDASAVTYAVTGVTINAKAEGTYTYGATPAWTSSATAMDYTLTAPSSVTETAVAFASDLMMLPQTGATITVKYTYAVSGSTSIEQTKTLNFPAWEIGSNTAYTLTLDGAKEIVITGSVGAEWDGEDDGTLTE